MMTSMTWEIAQGIIWGYFFISLDHLSQRRRAVSQHTIQTEIEIFVSGDDDVAYPMIEITYDYSRGSPAFTPRGEYGPIDPPEPPGLEFRQARLIAADGAPR